MNMKKSIAVLLAAVLLLGALAACSAKTQPAASSQAASAQTAASSAPAQSASQSAAASSTAASSSSAAASASASSSAAACTSSGKSCEQNQAITKPVIRLGGLKGPTSIGLVGLLSKAEQQQTKNDYSFQMAGTADELTPLFVQGKLDVIAAPINLASVLYSKTKGQVKLLAINTLGVLYIVEKGGQTVTDVKSLKGQTIYATGKGAVPEYTLRYLLSQNGLDPDKDVTIEFKSEPTEIVAEMAAKDHVIAMLPQPYVVVAQGKVKDLRVALDLTKEWDKLSNGCQLLTAGLIVRAQYLQENPQAVADFLTEYAESAAYVNSNVDEASQLVEKYDIVKAAVAKAAIPSCNIVCITGDEMKKDVSGYLTILSQMNPKAVGGALPADDFYYTAQ
jgi:NitT/TauT family transport system substrate-binding protein